MAEERTVKESCNVLDRSLHARGIPYFTDNVEKLKKKIAKKIEKKCKDYKVEQVICPLGGTQREAIVILKGKW